MDAVTRTRATVALVLLARVAGADPGRDQDRALAEDPDPAMPGFALEWRDGLRAEAGAAVPLVRADDRLGFELQLPGFIELHNDGPGVVPYELWRGHIAVLAAERWLAGGFTLRVHGAVEHESDHDIDHHWIYWEGIAGGFTATHDDARWRWTAMAQLRFLFETCTTSYACTSNDGRGDVSVQPSTALVAELLPARRGHAFAAVYADATLGNGVVVAEHRAIVHVGFALDAGTRGRWQFYAVALAGREVGLDSVLGDQLHYGIGARWEP